MKVYFVEYRWGGDTWATETTFSDRESAELYIGNLVMQAQAGVIDSLEGYTADDFRVTEKEFA